MAKKKDTPSLTRERVWKAIRAGSFEVEEFPGTKMLRVIRGRIRLTWTERGKKKHTRRRFRLVYLNPTWIPLPKNYPISVGSLCDLSQEKLSELGIVRLNERDFRLLIYRQLGDLPSLLRQISKHIRPKYEKEVHQLWRTLEEISSREPSKVGQTVPTKALFKRVKRIGTINTHMAGRQEAVESRITRLSRTQRLVKGSLKMLIDLVPKSGEKNIEGTVKGLCNSLSRNHRLLKQLLNDAIYSKRARWARYHISKARMCLVGNNFNRARYHFKKAIAHL